VPQAAAPVRLHQILSGLSDPVYLTAPPGDSRLFVVEKTGKILVVAHGHLLSQPFLDISGELSQGGEQGLLSMAFDPGYAGNGRFYVSFTNTAGDSRIVRYRVSRGDPDAADPASATTLLKLAQPFDNHNGGDIGFGPDGLLYIGFGDGGSEGDPDHVGQLRTGLLSKIVRMDVHAKTPVAKVYAYGFRNPWRFSFDRSTGDLWIGDVGQDSWEEVDRIPRGTPAMPWRRARATARSPAATCSAGRASRRSPATTSTATTARAGSGSSLRAAGSRLRCPSHSRSAASARSGRTRPGTST
jgi:glucose/arabinose dehydrogenase